MLTLCSVRPGSGSPRRMATDLRMYAADICVMSSTKFDHSLHEALEEVESDEQEGVVVEEVQKGYKLNDKVIRPAKVKVAKRKDKHE